MQYTLSEQSKKLMKAAPLMPVMVIKHIEQAIPMAQALLDGGISVFEVTLRTEAGLLAISAIKEAFPEATVGVGTVANVDDLERSVNAGAEFVISPGVTESLVKAGAASGVPFLPGISSVSELMLCLENGIDAVKFFPAEASGGVKTLKAFGGPFPDVAFCPTGGVNMKNLADYLAVPSVYTVGGSWILPSDAIDKGDWETITQLTKTAVDAVNTIRNQN